MGLYTRSQIFIETRLKFLLRSFFWSIAVLGIFFDSETNGLNSQKHKIIEIAFQILDVVTGEVKDAFESVISVSPEDWKKSDPESLRVNGFTWEKTTQGLSPT